MIAAPKYAVSVHTGIVDKPDEPTRRLLGKGWEAAELSETEIAEVIREGWPLAPQYRGGTRKTPNFIRSGFVAADVDVGMTLDEARDHPFVRHHAALVHTTVSHTADHNRFRVIFLLDEAVLSAQDWADAQLGLALKIKSDTSVTDGARMFFGCTHAAIFFISRTLPPMVVADLIAAGRDARASRTPGGGVLPVVSARQFVGPELIKAAGGDFVRFDELNVGVRLHCPHHDDGDPSAYALRSRAGRIGIHCSACKVTFWPTDERDGYDFKEFDRIFEARAAGQQEVDPDAVGFERFFPPAPRFEKQQSGFLSALTYTPGITLVKSPKGSGKTVALQLMLDQVRAGRFLGEVSRRDRPKSVLLVGHRQSLLREAAAKLGLYCYLDAGDEASGLLKTLAVTLDSLPKFNEPNSGTPRKAYDLVIIDESEQVFGHLFGETIKKGRGLERCFDALNYEVSNAKSVIALDADLGLVTTHALRTMRPQDWDARCRIVYNAPIVPEQRRVMRLHSDRKHLEAEMIRAINRGERCFIVSNSKKFIDVVHRMILNQCGEDVVMRVVTSDNSRDDAIIRFLANIKEEFLNVQVVLGTPSIGTGIDITFPNGECRVDRVFGFFHPFINTHMDIDQQLYRVRNPGMVDVWISPTTFRFTCNVEIIMDDLARAYVVKRAVKGRREDGMIDYDRHDPLLMICAHVTALQRASKNRLTELFCELRRANAWHVELVGDVELEGHYAAAKKMIEAERKELLLNAEPLNNDDYIELDDKFLKGASLTKEERARHEKSRFERMVGLPLDGDLVEMNVDGKLLERVISLSGVVAIWSCAGKWDPVQALLRPTLQPKGRLEAMKPSPLVAVLMRAAGLTGPNGVDLTKPISLDRLACFVAVCRDNRTLIEEVLGIGFRDDFAQKPVRQLNQFLRRVGLKVTVSKVEKVPGRKVRYYSVPTGLLETMMRLAKSYIEAEAGRERERELSLVKRPRPERGKGPPDETGHVVVEEPGLLSAKFLV